MNLLYQGPRVMVFHGEWQALNLPADSVDIVLTDPPYTDHVHANVRSCSTSGTVKVKVYDLKFEALSGYEHVPQLISLARRWVLCFCALEQLGAYQAAAGGPRQSGGAHVRSGIWRKQHAAPQLSGDRPANSCEGWALLHRTGGKLAWNGRGKHAFHDCTRSSDDVNHGAFAEEDAPSFIEAGRERGVKRHPAQKPTGLCKALADWFVNSGDTVLDPYAGSGNLGFAAYDRGASIILVDADLEWAQFCAERAARTEAK